MVLHVISLMISIIIIMIKLFFRRKILFPYFFNFLQLFLSLFYFFDSNELFSLLHLLHFTQKNIIFIWWNGRLMNFLYWKEPSKGCVRGEKVWIYRNNSKEIYKLDWRSHKWLQWFIFHLVTHNLSKFDEVLMFQICSNI